jgi:hypothetical protein
MIHAAPVEQQRKNLMEFPNSRIGLALRIMPMYCILQPGLPVTAVAAAGEGIFLYICTAIAGIYFIFIFIFMIYSLVLTKSISKKGCMDDI